MLELWDLRAGYGHSEVLHGIRANLCPGQLVCILGPNGCGKSTLLKTLPGILPITGGKILLDGRAVTDYPRTALAKRMAYLSQGRRIPAMTVGELVLHGRFPHLQFPRRYSAEDRRIAEDAMVQMGISAEAKRPLSALSGGMRQSAFLAMALAQQADYILLDEPTTYLDIGHQLELMRLLRSIADGGCAVAAIMHDLPLALTYADAVWVMRNGVLVMSGTPGEVCTSGVLHEVFGVDMIADNGSYYCRLGRD